MKSINCIVINERQISIECITCPDREVYDVSVNIVEEGVYLGKVRNSSSPDASTIFCAVIWNPDKRIYELGSCGRSVIPFASIPVGNIGNNGNNNSSNTSSKIQIPLLHTVVGHAFVEDSSVEDSLSQSQPQRRSIYTTMFIRIMQTEGEEKNGEEKNGDLASSFVANNSKDLIPAPDNPLSEIVTTAVLLADHLSQQDKCEDKSKDNCEDNCENNCENNCKGMLLKVNTFIGAVKPS